MLDAGGLAACYHTLKGVGFAGNVAADTKKPRRGLPIKVLVALCMCARIPAPFLVIGLTRYISNTVAFLRSKVLPACRFNFCRADTPRCLCRERTRQENMQIKKSPVVIWAG